MNLEANKFLNRLYNEANDRERSQNLDIIDKIKRIGKQQIEEVTASQDIDIKNYEYFQKMLSILSYQIYRGLTTILNNDKIAFQESYAKIIAAWNNLISSLIMLNYQTLSKKDKYKVNNSIFEIKSSITSLLEYVKQLSLTNDNYDILKIPLNNMLTQIESQIYQQVSYPSKEYEKIFKKTITKQKDEINEKKKKKVEYNKKYREKMKMKKMEKDKDKDEDEYEDEDEAEDNLM